MKDDPNNAEAALQRKTCVACGFLIPTTATLCSECSSYQASWRNSLRYFASVGGILVVVITLATYLASIFPAARKAIAWRDEVDLISFYSEGVIVFRNKGDGPIFLSHMDISAALDAEEFFRFSIPINKQLENESFLSVDYKNPHKEMKNGIFVELKGKEDIFRYLRPAVDPSNKCFELVFFLVSDPKYIQVSHFLDHLLVYEEVNASLTYYNVRSKEKVDKFFPVVASIVQSKSPKCVRENS